MFEHRDLLVLTPTGVGKTKVIILRLRDLSIGTFSILLGYTIGTFNFTTWDLR